jgi:hypothetical protein
VSWDEDGRLPQREKIPSVHSFGDFLGMLLVTAIGGTMLGGVIWMIIGVSHGPRAGAAVEKADLTTGLILGCVIVGAIMFFIFVSGADVQSRLQQQADNRYRHDLEQYELEKKKREREREEYDKETIRRQQAEAERVTALKKRQAEEAAAAAIAAEKAARVRAWEEAFHWARVSFEQQYHGLAMTLAAEQGVTNPDDVLKVFAEAYPHLNISTDWRMGCLRELAADRRIAAILPRLPPADAQNTRPC